MEIKTLTTEIKTLITKFENCEIETNMINQHDEYLLKSALKNLNDFSMRRMKKFYGDFKAPLMECVNFLSTFEAPELNRAWVD